ncbi:putative WRKY transcription factor 70 [Sesamum angolense]|uniref:WRKY transcription factor 70 n=1 Tax=Sesamum angolense TaxID=2727404 RepID=A0AAE1WMC4_9LAMI|nr:putative WRKY transcription factor 70 [Sesamum angolense]
MIGELSRGRKVADELRLMLRHTTPPLDATLVLPAAQSLVATILETFTHSLSILSPTAAAAHSDEVSQLPPLKSEDCAATTPPTKDRRGCYKRRRSSETSTIETASLSEDGHAWRKYGQKVILNAKHPRSYFRCTHKFDQDCQATKQVQRIEDDPPRFRTTYHGRHTCKNLFNSSPHHHHMMMMQDAAADDHDHSPIMWSFAATHDDDHNIHPKTTSLVMNDSSCSTAHINNTNTNAAGHHPVLVVLKQENKELPEPQIKSSSSSSSSDATFVCPDHDPTKFDTMSSAPPPHHHHQLGAFSPAASSDVYSCTESTHSMEMDMMSMAVNFDDFLDLQTLN